MPIVDVIQMELFLEQTNVFIDLNVGVESLGTNRHVLLSNGLDEAHLGETFLEAGHEGEGGGRFSDVLFCGGDEDGSWAFGCRRAEIT